VNLIIERPQQTRWLIKCIKSIFVLQGFFFFKFKGNGLLK